MYLLITHAVGFLGTCLLALSFQFKKSGTLFLLQLFSSGAYIVHFLMLKAYSGCVNVFFAFVRNILLCVHRPWAEWRGWPWLLAGFNITATIIAWQDVFSILPCAGMAAVTLVSWSRNGKKVRLANLFVASPSMLIYTIHTGSYSGILCELICIGSVLTSVWRYGWKALDSTGD